MSSALSGPSQNQILIFWVQEVSEESESYEAILTKQQRGWQAPEELGRSGIQAFHSDKVSAENTGGELESEDSASGHALISNPVR
jgi:hypothetical protein